MSIIIIAEAGINHNGNIETAKELIRQAKECGADIWKTQLYDVGKSFLGKKIIAQGRNWYEEVKKTQLSKDQTFLLADYCKEVGIEFMASAPDLERLGWLEEIGVKRHKVGSSMNKNKELIDVMLKTGKQILISDKIPVSYYNPGQTKHHQYSVLYCIPEYPTSLLKLKLSKVLFGTAFVGFSDHTQGIEASMVAMARGAIIIEKHFTLDKTDPRGPDHICSVELDELRQLVRFARKCEEIIL